jgi:hypothetical protein
VSAHVPPGWPSQVRPPDSEGWEATAVAFLLDVCPPDYRRHEVLRRHPVVLARFAVRHVDGAVAAARTGYAHARSDLRDLVPPEVVTAALAAFETEGARLVATARQVALVEEALRGRRHAPRL